MLNKTGIDISASTEIESRKIPPFKSEMGKIGSEGQRQIDGKRKEGKGDISRR